MTDLVPRCALGDIAPRVLQLGRFRIAEDAAPVLHAIATADASGLPGPGRYADGAFWIAPGQWMLEREAPHGVTTTDQSDAWAVFEIEGDVKPLLEKLVNVDLARFGPGSATRTGLEHMSVFVIRRAADRLAILGTRSAAGSIWHALERAVRNLEAA